MDIQVLRFKSYWYWAGKKPLLQNSDFFWEAGSTSLLPLRLRLRLRLIFLALLAYLAFEYQAIPP